MGLLLIFLLPWLAFGRSIFQDFAAIDDGFLIINNPIVHGMDFERIKLAFTTFDPELYIPLTIISFQLNWLMGAGSTVPFHITNILLQGINGVLVGIIFSRWTKSQSLALAAAMLFAVHPLHTEAVVWAAGRKDLLCTALFLLSYLSFRQWNSRHSYLMLVGSLLLFVLALLSKVLAATLPVILLLDMMLLQKRKSAKSMAAMLLPFVAASAALLYVATFGKERILASSSLWDTIVMAQKSSAFYLWKLLVPVGLTVIYPFQGTISLAAPEFFLPALLNIALIAIAIWQWRKRPLISFGILFYFVTLSPTFFNFHKGELLFFAVDRYAYIPSIGFLLAVIVTATELCQWLQLSTVIPKVFLGIIVLIFTGLSMYQTTIWDSPDSLFGHAIQLYPESVSARMAMASILLERNRAEEAFAILKEGLRYNDSPGLHLQAGLIYSATGQISDAREQFEKVLQLSPHLSPPMYYLGFLDETAGNDESAMNWYRKAIDNDSSHVPARTHLAALLMKRREYTEAKIQLTEAFEWNKMSLEVTDGMIDLAKARNDAAGVQHWTQWRAFIGTGALE